MDAKAVEVKEDGRNFLVSFSCAYAGLSQSRVCVVGFIGKDESSVGNKPIDQTRLPKPIAPEEVPYDVLSQCNVVLGYQAQLRS